MSTNNEQPEQVKAFKILRLNEELRNIDAKRKAVTRAFSDEKKRINLEITAILAGEATSKEIIDNVADVRDLDLV